MGGSHKFQNFALLTATIAMIGIFFQNCGRENPQSASNTGLFHGESAPSNAELMAPPPTDGSGYTICPSQGIFIEKEGRPNEFVAANGAKYFCLVNHEAAQSLNVSVRFAGPETICSQLRVLALPNPDLKYPGLVSPKGNNIIMNLGSSTGQSIPAGVYIIKVEGLDNTCIGKISRFSISWQN